MTTMHRRFGQSFSRAVVATVLVVAFFPFTARGQALSGIEEYAAAITALTARRWAGQRVPGPVERDRPASELAVRAIDANLAVHASAETPESVLETAMRGTRRMHDALLVRGFGRIGGDGDLGGGPDFDVYLVPRDSPYETVSDGPTPFTFLDGIIDHVVLDDSLRGERLEACAAEAYADALLARLDPAESVAMRRSLATTLAWLETGRFDGCTDDVGRAQARPFAGFLAPGEADASAAPFFAELSRRNDRGDGSFLRETWTMARQRTWEGERYRGSPDFLEAIGASARLVGGSLDRSLVDFAISRIALANPSRDRDATVVGFPALPPDESVPVAFDGAFRALPIRTVPHAPVIEATGSAYARIDVDPPTDARLRVFLRGESFTRWSLVAVALGADGHERSRIEAPIRDRVPDAYLTVELANVRTVYVVVTNLGLSRPDADVATNDGRTFYLMLDSARD